MLSTSDSPQPSTFEKSELTMRALFTLFLTSLLIACASPPRGYLDLAEDYIDDEDFIVGYRFLERGLTSEYPKIKARAIELYESEPEVRAAAAKTFSYETLIKNSEVRHFDSGPAIEKQRLQSYAVVATNDELRVASDNYQKYLKFNAKAKEVAEAADAVIAAKEKAAADAALEKEREEKIKRFAAFERSKAKAIFPCKNRQECEKAFSLTQIYIANNVDMKIEMANDTVIQTHNPIKAYTMGASAFKVPTSGTSAEIRLIAKCIDSDIPVLAAKYSCMDLTTNLNHGFSEFLHQNLIN